MSEATEAPAPVRRNRWDSAGVKGDDADAKATANAEATTTATAAATAAVASAGLDAAGLLQAKNIAREALAKAQLAAEVQRALMSGAPTMPAPAKPAVVTIDNQGRLLDESGKVIKSTARPQATVKANQQQRVNPLLDDTPVDLGTDSKFYDASMPAIGQGRDVRKKRAFSFVAEGHYSRKADDLRAKAVVELMLQEASHPAAKRRAAASSLAAARDAAAVGAAGGVQASTATVERRLAEVPAVEW